MPSPPKPKPLQTRIRTISPGFLPIPIWRRWLALVILKRIFPLSTLKRHGFMVARSGVGKSELLKLLVLRLKCRYVSLPGKSAITSKRTVVLLDPHGELAAQCARQTVFHSKHHGSPNLVYLAPQSNATINPLEVRGANRTKEAIQRRAQFLTHAFAAMIGHSRQDLSVHMKALLTPMLEVLLTFSSLHPENPATLFNLADFLEDKRNASLVHFARSKVPNAGLQQFFAGMFQHPRYQASKFSLRSKLMSLLNQKAFVNLLARPHSTWDLEAILDSGKTLIINASKSELGAEVSAIYGRTLLALIKSHVFLRQSARRTPIFLLIDEAMTFLTEDMQTILEELRKFGLHLVLAMQSIPQGERQSGLASSLLANTGLKITGAGSYATLRKMALETGIPKEAFAKLKVGRFLIANQGRRPILLKIPNIWRNWRQTISQKRFQETYTCKPIPDTKKIAQYRPSPCRPWL